MVTGFFFGGDGVCYSDRKALRRFMRREHRQRAIYALAENSPPDCFLFARLRIAPPPPKKESTPLRVLVLAETVGFEPTVP